MEIKNHFIVTFNDLTDKKQDEIVRAMVRSLLDEGHLDYDESEADARAKAERLVTWACAETSYSWEIEVKI